jgi:hypothetical protein
MIGQKGRTYEMTADQDESWLIRLSRPHRLALLAVSLELREGESGKQVIIGTSFTTFALREFCARPVHTC